MKNIFSRHSAAARILCLSAAALLAACGSNPDKDRPENPFKTATAKPGAAKAPQSDAELRLAADQLYRRAHTALENSDWTPAADRLQQLVDKYPFSDYATQAAMEKIYVEYKNYHSDEAISEADRFLRAHPRSSQAEYVQYLKGLVNFTRDEGFLDAIGAEVSGSRRDVSNLLRAFEDFSLLIQRYPNSIYCGDARRRMLYLRNHIAEHELSVAQYYMRRGAWVAAARRSESVIADYPGAPATEKALVILERAYRNAGLTQQADDAAKIIALNADNKPVSGTAPALGQRTQSSTAATTVVADTGGSSTEQPGFFSRLGKLFDIFDTSKPEHQYTVTLPGGAAASATSAADSAETTTTNSNAADSASHAPAKHSLQFSIGYPDAQDGAASTEAPPSAKPAEGASPQP